MDKSKFFSNLIGYSKREGFSFLLDESSANLEKMSTSKQIVFKLLMGTGLAAAGNPGLGFLMALNATNPSTEGNESLIADLQKMQNQCDLIGIKLSDGPVILRLGVDADEISDESLIGRFAVVHEQAHDFRKHSSTLLKSRFKETKFGIFAQIVVVFSSHGRTEHFIQFFADKCNHSAFFKKVYTYPWIVDLENEKIKRYRQPFDNIFGRGEKLKAELFSK